MDFSLLFTLLFMFSYGATVHAGVANPPAWLQGTETTSISENVPTGSSVTTTTTAINSPDTVTILGTSTGANAQTLFSVSTDGTNIQLTTAGSLDAEITAQFVLHLRASNSAGDTSTEANYGDLELTVDVTDVNDNNPVFSTASTCKAMSANAAGSTSVETLAATDADASSSLTYTFSAAQTYFDVSNMGEVTVKSSQTLSAGSYNMEILASDGGGSPATATLTVCAGSACCSSCTDGCSSSGVKHITVFSAFVLFGLTLLLI